MALVTVKSIAPIKNIIRHDTCNRSVTAGSVRREAKSKAATNANWLCNENEFDTKQKLIKIKADAHPTLTYTRHNRFDSNRLPPAKSTEAALKS